MNHFKGWLFVVVLFSKVLNLGDAPVKIPQYFKQEMGQKLYDHTKHEMLLSKNQKIIRMSLKYIALKNPK